MNPGVHRPSLTSDLVEPGRDLRPGVRLRCLCRGHNDVVNRIAWSPFGDLLASPSRDGTVRVWNALSGDCLRQVDLPKARVYGAGWSADSTMVAAASWQDTVCFEVPNGKLHSLDIDSANCVAWSPGTDRTVLAVGTEQPNVRVIEQARQRYGRAPREFRAARGNINNLAWSRSGDLLAAASGDKNVYVWSANGELLHKLHGHSNWAFGVAWHPNGELLASASWDGRIALWDVATGRLIRFLEAHGGELSSVSFSFDGKWLASKGKDHIVLLWRTDSWTAAATIPETSSGKHSPGVAFHASLPLLATLGESDTVIRVWEIDAPAVLSVARTDSNITYCSAKIALVGESNVGKSCLATRLCEDRYPGDEEFGSTHGMRMLRTPAAVLGPRALGDSRERREITLWDFGGQPDYKLVHQMFLRDASVALVLIDPTRGKAAFDEAREWSKRLAGHLAGARTVTILVGAKQDRESLLVDRAAIGALCRQCGFSNYIEVSAKTGRNVADLREAIASALEWTTTSRPELFQLISDELDKLRLSGQAVLLFDEFCRQLHSSNTTIRSLLRREIALSSDEDAGKRAIDAVCHQLSQQGEVADTQLEGRRALVLRVEEVERYAGALLIAARTNRLGVPALEVRQIGAGEGDLPGIDAAQRLPRIQERVVLECVAELMIRHGLCFGHEGLLLFPAAFSDSHTHSESRSSHSVWVTYDFRGATDNVYASLVARVVTSERFGKTRLWPNKVEFDEPGHGICAIRYRPSSNGDALLDISFGDDVSDHRRNLFLHTVESHLIPHNATIVVNHAVTCRRCNREIDKEVVRRNVDEGHSDVICQWCREVTPIGNDAAALLKNDREGERESVRLRRETDEKVQQDARTAVRLLGTGKGTSGRPIRVVHLSDFHFTADTRPERLVHWLQDDLTNPKSLGFDAIDYLVVSGDLTDRGSLEGFERAREFVSLFCKDLDISIHACVFVPGNHDICDQLDWYPAHERVDGLPNEHWVRQGDIFLVRDEAKYRWRVRAFSDAFFHKLYQKPYPEEYAHQGIAYTFADTGVQFLTLNSCWQIDRFHRKRSGVHPDAVSNLIKQADTELKEAGPQGKASGSLLRIGVWHHALAHPEMMQDVTFLEHLEKNGVRLALHGDVHEVNCDRIHQFHGGQLNVLGGGSFGSSRIGLPDSTGRHYNVLEIEQDKTKVRVHTREQRRADGAWDGWYQWPNPDGGQGRLPYFDIELGGPRQETSR